MLVVQSNITCPECRKTSDVPNGGVEKLPNNFFINRLLDEVALKRKVEGEEEAKCDQCVREDPAEALCLDCGIFLCNYCYGHHEGPATLLQSCTGCLKSYSNLTIFRLEKVNFSVN